MSTVTQEHVWQAVMVSLLIGWAACHVSARLLLDEHYERRAARRARQGRT